MLCSFIKKKREWICENCGRRVIIDNQKAFQPSAKCRIPNKLDQYAKKQNQHNEFYQQNHDGVGTHFINIIKTINKSYFSECKHKSKINAMDYNGVEWCEKNLDAICESIKQECEQKNILYLPKKTKALIRLAIRKAKADKK